MKDIIGRIQMDGEICGTGILISPDIVLTAKHVVTTFEDVTSNTSEEKNVSFITESGEIFEGTTIGISQSINSEDDYILIQLVMDLTESDFSNLCVPTNDFVGMQCRIVGYSKLSNEKKILTGCISHAEKNCFSINVDENNQFQDYSGLSGSPVYISRFIVGIVVTQEGKQIKVLPIKKIASILKTLCIAIKKQEIHDYSFEDASGTVIIQKSKIAIQSAGPRYSEKLNVETGSLKQILFLLKKNSLSEYINEICDVIKDCYKLYSEFINSVSSDDDLILKDNRKILNSIFDKISNDLKNLVQCESIPKNLNNLSHEYENYSHELRGILKNEIIRFEEKHGKGTFENKKWRGLQASYMCLFPTHYLDELKNIISLIDKVREKIAKNRTIGYDNQAILVVGKGGTGKTHLLCDVVNNLISKDVPAILTYGELFLSPEMFFKYFPNTCSQFDDIDKLLQLIDYIGSYQEYYIPICIDAINETKNKDFWNSTLPILISKIEQFKNIKLILSCRTIYCKEYLDDDILNRMFKIHHKGFEDCQENAINEFCNFYNIKIVYDSVNIPELHNPLILNMLCEIAKERPSKTVEFSDVYSLMDEFMNIKNKKITAYYKNELSVRDEIVQKCMFELANYMTKNDTYSLSWIEVRNIVSGILDNWDLKRETAGIIKNLISENLLREYDENEKQISFGYQRYYEFIYAESLIKLETPALIQKIRNREVSLGTLEAINILYIKKNLNEISNLMSDEQSEYILDAFLNSLYWRKNDEFTDETIDIILKSLHSNNTATIEKTIFYLLDLAIKVECPVNALFIHERLSKMKPLFRNYFLSYFFLKKYDSIKVVSDLCERALNTKQNAISNEASFLLKIILCWGTSLNDLKIRDYSSKGLSALFVAYPFDYGKLYGMFKNIEDDYIHERFWQAVYSSLVVRTDKKITSNVINLIVNEILEKGIFPQNVLIRDYLRNIFEYAFYKGWCSEELVKRLRPPYKSNIHKVNIEFVNIHKEENRTLFWNCTESDFAIYTIPHTDFNFEISQKDVGCLIFEDIINLGYSNSPCKEYDSYIDATYGSLRSRDEGVERIGKKLQKIFLYREIGMIYDNYLYKPRYETEKNEIVPSLQGSEFRYIDMMRMPIKNSFEGKKFDYPFFRFKKWDYYKWCNYDDIEDYILELLTCQRYDNELIILQGSFTSKEEKNEKYREVWMHIHAYLYKKKNKGKLLEWLKGKDFEGRWMPEGMQDIYDICIGEYPWNTTMQSYLLEFYNEEQNMYNRGYRGIQYPCKLITTVDGYNSEKDSPFLDEMCDSFLFPSDFWFKHLDLKWDGEYCYLIDGKKIFYNTANNSMYVDRVFLKKFLENNGYDIMWTVLGEKLLLGGFGLDYPGRCEFSYSYYWNDNMQIKKNHRVFNQAIPNKRF